jgi:hypothetical protein
MIFRFYIFCSNENVESSDYYYLINLLDRHNSSFPILRSGHFPEVRRFVAGEVLTQDPIRGLLLQDRVEFENQTESRASLLLLTAAQRQVGFGICWKIY